MRQLEADHEKYRRSWRLRLMDDTSRGRSGYSGFEYESGINRKMFFCTATTIYDTTTTTPAVVKTGQTSGYHYVAQFSNQGGDWLVVVNKNGDPPLRFNGTTWVTLSHTTPANWAVSTAYVVGDRRVDTADASIWKCAVAHTSPGTGTFAAARTASPLTWAIDSASDAVSWITGRPVRQSSMAAA